MHVPPLIVLSFEDRLVAVNAHTGERVWTVETEAAHDGQLRVDDSRVFYLAKRKLWCLGYLDGRRLWTAELPRGVGSAPNILAYEGCVVVLGNGEAAAISAHNGAILWHDGFAGFGIYGGAIAAPGIASPIDKE
jgi:outer membrane protein assembly factor BamB